MKAEEREIRRKRGRDLYCSYNHEARMPQIAPRHIRRARVMKCLTPFERCFQ